MKLICCKKSAGLGRCVNLFRNLWSDHAKDTFTFDSYFWSIRL